jgi:hypothetical protein
MRVFMGVNQATGKPKLLLTFPGIRDSVIYPIVVNAWPGKDFSLLQSSVDVKAFLTDKKMSDEEADQKAAGVSSNKPVSPKRRSPGGASTPPSHRVR